MDQLSSAAIAAMAAKLRRVPARRPPFECIALLLQGGGALGSYQAGVYAALAEAELQPDWVAGISIGAINGALIAGNAPERRVEQLRTFWEQITVVTHGFDAWLAPLSGTSDTPARLDEPDECCAVAGWGRAWVFHAASYGTVVRSGRWRRRHQLL
jgi:predicted acylesterase/phospholipase RssA